jgi:hypothetical protein
MALLGDREEVTKLTELSTILDHVHSGGSSTAAWDRLGEVFQA